MPWISAIVPPPSSTVPLHAVPCLIYNETPNQTDSFQIHLHHLRKSQNNIFIRCHQLVMLGLNLIHKFLNLVAPLFTFFSLCLFLPPFYLFKSFLSALSFIFSENVNGKVVLITGASSGIGEVNPTLYEINNVTC